MLCLLFTFHARPWSSSPGCSSGVSCIDPQSDMYVTALDLGDDCLYTLAKRVFDVQCGIPQEISQAQSVINYCILYLISFCDVYVL